jgi:murein L,D-transpeptidase YafK
MRNYFILFLMILLLCAGCSNSSSTPREVHFVEVQRLALLKADVTAFAPDEYRRYSKAYRDATNILLLEENKFKWFRDYDQIRKDYWTLLGDGNKILATIKRINDQKALDIAQKITYLKDRIASIKDSTSNINEGRLVRKSLSKAEVLLSESECYYQKGDYDTAKAKLSTVNTYALQSLTTANSILGRYMDKNQLTKWRNLVEDTISESRRKGIVVIIVSKIDQELMVYKNGSLVKTYDVGLGRNGLKDKLYAGDGATPEGRYYIVKKNGASRYYKALLFDYPNKEDRLEFAKAKKKGQIPARVGIGNLLEVHGGGSDGMTKGCISLENKDMDKLYSMVDAGTPLTIVGAINGAHNSLPTLEDKQS